mmetsp:Transcript_4568/g.7002  ORF Transcript_4568/g.7002 Transcript_4568/m.7002 type:complete len:130 (-) Transcript_4568:1130-1519(-)
MSINMTFFNDMSMPGRTSPKKPPPVAEIVVALMAHTTIANACNVIFSKPFEALSPIMLLEQLNLTNGVKANGSNKPSNAFTMFMRLLSRSGNSTDTMTPGTIAIKRVAIDLTAIGIWRFRNPSITYCPV